MKPFRNSTKIPADSEGSYNTLSDTLYMGHSRSVAFERDTFDGRTGTQIIKSTIAYLDFRSGSAWRSSSTGDRFNPDRIDYLAAIHILLGTLHAPTVNISIPISPAKADDDPRLTELTRLTRPELVRRLFRMRPDLNPEILGHLQRIKLAGMLIREQDAAPRLEQTA